MNCFQKVPLFLGMSVRLLLKAFSRSLLYFSVPKARVTLMSVGTGGSEVIQSMTRLRAND